MRTIRQQLIADISANIAKIGFSKQESDVTAKRFVQRVWDKLPVSYRITQNEMVFYGENGTLSVDMRTHEMCVWPQPSELDLWLAKAA
jgi:hypothetical protein